MRQFKLSLLGTFEFAQTLLQIDDYTKIQHDYEHALAMAKAIGNPDLETRWLNNLTLIAWFLGDYTSARTYCEQALVRINKTGQHQQKTTTLINLSLLSYALGDYAAAKDYAQQALSLSQSFNQRANESWALIYLGDALAKLGHPAEAKATYLQALVLQPDKDQPCLATEVRARLTELAFEQGHHYQAQACLEEILHQLEANRIVGTVEPLRIYLTCYRILYNKQDHRAFDILERAYRLLQSVAGKISEPWQRRTFLENNFVHHEIINRWQETRTYA